MVEYLQKRNFKNNRITMKKKSTCFAHILFTMPAAKNFAQEYGIYDFLN